MQPFFVFIIILIVIWTISGIATAVAKQKEQERRRQVRMQLERATAQQSRMPASLPPLPQRQISEGIAARFPDVLLPPDLPRPMQSPSPTRPTGPRSGKLKIRSKQARQQPVAVQPMPVPREEDPVSNLVTAAPPLAAVRSPAPGALAPAISRWLKPETLRQQFILTEIFQPPLALRDPDNR